MLVHLPFAVMGPGGLRFSYWVQLKRGLEVESLGGGILLVLDRLGLHSVTLRDEAPGSRDAVGTLADAVAVVSSLAVVAAVLYVAWVYLRGRRDRVLACAAAVTAFVAFNKVLSPQYVAWLVPLVPAAGLVASGVLVVVLALTRAEWDRFVLAARLRPALGRGAVVVDPRSRPRARRALRAARRSSSGREPDREATADDAAVARAPQQRAHVRLDVAAEHEDVRDVSMPLGLAVVRRVDAEVVGRVAGIHATVARERMRVARLRADRCAGRTRT